MTSRLYMPDGRDFDSVFAHGKSGYETGYYTLAGDDVGSLFAGGGSDEESTYYDPSGRDIAKLFRLKGDADIELFTLMEEVYSWGRWVADLQAGAVYYDPSSGDIGNAHKEYTNTYHQDLGLHIYERLLAGYRVEWAFHFGTDGSTDHTYPGTLAAPYEFIVEQYPTKEAPQLVFRAKAKKGWHNLSVRAVANIYVS